MYMYVCCWIDMTIHEYQYMSYKKNWGCKNVPRKKFKKLVFFSPDSRKKIGVRGSAEVLYCTGYLYGRPLAETRSGPCSAEGENLSCRCKWLSTLARRPRMRILRSTIVRKILSIHDDVSARVLSRPCLLDASSISVVRRAERSSEKLGQPAFHVTYVSYCFTWL